MISITKREKENIQQLSLGKTKQKIADEHFISLQTVKDNVHSIFRNACVNSRITPIRLLSCSKSYSK